MLFLIPILLEAGSLAFSAYRVYRAARAIQAGVRVASAVNKGQKAVKTAKKLENAAKASKKLKKAKKSEVCTPCERAKASWNPSKYIGNKLPKEWGKGVPNRRGVGTRWSDPKNPAGNGVRVDRGNPKSPYTSQKVDHIVVRKDGTILGRDGKPIKGSLKNDPENGHIPASEYVKWKKWDAP